jgi:2,4-dienoyl-CoA reductase (NADPH2)
MLQRRPGRFGDSLGRSTGWIHRLVLGRHGVETIAGAEYRRIDDAGLHISVAGAARVVPADTVVICAGQEPAVELAAALPAGGAAIHRIGGAREAAELDAVRAIGEGYRLALAL